MLQTFKMRQRGRWEAVAPKMSFTDLDAVLEAERTPARRGILSLNRETPQPVHTASAYADGGSTLARAG